MAANRIKIDLDRRVGTVDRRIFGGFIEHLGRCIYGGIFEEGSPLSDERGYRRDVLSALTDLHMPVLRWPGGNFVSGYHWQDGIGPRDQRPRRMDLAWHTEESNRFGTLEFLEYCRRLGTEPHVCVNLGTGTQDEAQAWVEFCNGTGNTYWANLRRHYGYDEPFRVKYWGLGNEMYGGWQIGALTAEDYVKKAREFAKAMLWTDPAIELISCGHNGWSDWDRIVLEGLARLVRLHSIHIYTGNDDYYRNVLAPLQAERALKLSRALIDQVCFNQGISHEIGIAYDEWNVWFRARGNETALEERYTLADALAVATFLNIFVRQSATVKMANLAQMVNVIAPVFTSFEGLFLQTIYYPLRLLSTHTQEVALAAWVACDTYDFPDEVRHSVQRPQIADLGPFPLLDVAATCSPNGQSLTLSVVNRSLDSAAETDLQLQDAAFAGNGMSHEVNAASVLAGNSLEQPLNVGVTSRAVLAAGSRLTYAFPAHSLTVLTLPVSRSAS